MTFPSTQFIVVFVEDVFAKAWVDTILRETLGADYDQIEVHAVHGDGNAVATHRSHMSNPAVRFKSLCIIDGDSQQCEDRDGGVIRLPGTQPELAVFECIRNRLDRDLAVLTVSCQRAPEAQDLVNQVLEQVASSNRDPHLLFNQVGIKIGFIPEATVRGAFLALWVRANPDFCADLANEARALIET